MLPTEHSGSGNITASVIRIDYANLGTYDDKIIFDGAAALFWFWTLLTWHFLDGVGHRIMIKISRRLLAWKIRAQLELELYTDLGIEVLGCCDYFVFR